VQTYLDRLGLFEIDPGILPSLEVRRSNARWCTILSLKLNAMCLERNHSQNYGPSPSLDHVSDDGLTLMNCGDTSS
jgi:hypothetical protein